MNLHDYLEVDRGRVRALADAIDVTPAYVRQMATKHRPVSERMAVRIERATGGAVRRQDLRADWRDIWPELAIVTPAGAA